LKRVLSTGSPVLNLETAGTLPHQAASNRWVCNYFPVRNAQGQVRQVGAIIVEKPGNVQSASIGRNNQQVVETLANSEALRSWKEIACYIGTCVKTVQRWEHVHGLPIRRLAASKGAVVFALKAEIDGWMRARSEHATSAIDEERMKAIFTYSPLPALVIDDNGVITEANARFLELIRSTRKHLVGKKFETLERCTLSDYKAYEWGLFQKTGIIAGLRNFKRADDTIFSAEYIIKKIAPATHLITFTVVRSDVTQQEAIFLQGRQEDQGEHAQAVDRSRLSLLDIS